jgi:lipopolysaccharide export LptBFGC system permease protein LptF
LKIIEKYLIISWFKWFSLCFLVLYFLLFIQLLNEGGNFLSNNSFFFTLNAFALNAFSYIPWLFPISCFVGTLFTFSFLSKDNELLALYSTGFSTFLIARPIIGLALICSLVSWVCRDVEKYFGSTHSSYAEGTLTGNSKFSSFHMRIKSINRTWFFGNYDIETGIAENVHLYFSDKEGNDLYRIRAQLGQKSSHGWTFKNGFFLGFLSDGRIPIINEAKKISWEPSVTSIESYSSFNSISPRYKKEFSEIQLPNINDDPKPFALLQKSPKELDFEGLNDLLRNFPDPNSPQLYPYRMRKAQLLWNAPSCLFACICALALTLQTKQNSSTALIGNALLWIIIFYLCRTLCDTLGKHGFLTEWISTGIPLFFFLMISIRMLWRSR